MELKCGDVTVDVLVVKDIAIKASAAVLEVYEQDDFGLEFKAGDEPLTRADKQSNDIICTLLTQYYPTIPIISEENKKADYETRKDYQYFWCIDPLDGTKEFIKRNGQFTVNIGLCERETPIAGVVTIPVEKKCYYAAKGLGAYRQNETQPPVKIQTSEFCEQDEGLTLVASLTHSNQATEAFIAKFKEPRLTSLGSSLKFMLIAEGNAQVYPRLAPTNEWDTCAADAIVREAGGDVLQLKESGLIEGPQLQYNKPSFLNPFFVVYGKRLGKKQH
eukprot:Platyproteum_vivax@DN8511_c0_g1_i1.p1